MARSQEAVTEFDELAGWFGEDYAARELGPRPVVGPADEMYRVPGAWHGPPPQAIGRRVLEPSVRVLYSVKSRAEETASGLGMRVARVSNIPGLRYTPSTDRTPAEKLFQTVQGTSGFREIRRASESSLWATGSLYVEQDGPLVTAHFALDEISDAYEDLVAEQQFVREATNTAPPLVEEDPLFNPLQIPLLSASGEGADDLMDAASTWYGVADSLTVQLDQLGLVGLHRKTKERRPEIS